MTKLIADLLSIEKIDKYNCDGLILNIDKFSVFNDKKFTVDEVKLVSDKIKKINKLLIVNIDKIIEENQTEELYNILDQLFNIDIDYYIYSDLSVLSYFMERSSTNKLIYDAKTMITSPGDSSFYRDLGVLTIVSNELSLGQVKEISEIGNACLEVYGYHQIFYSRRKLLSIFNEFNESDYQIKDRVLHIKEEMRDSLYPIYQSDNGTFVYTNYIYCAFLDIVDFYNNFKFLKVNSMFINEDKILQVIDIYRNFIDKKYESLEEEFNKLLAIDDNLSNGFLKGSSFLLKEGN